MTIVSPSSRNRRVSPEASVTGWRPPAEISSRLPSPPSSGAGDRAGPEQIAGPQVAAAAAVVRDQLGDGPIEMMRVADRQSVRREPLGRETRREQEHLELDVERARCLVGFIEQIGQAGQGRPRAAAPARRGTAASASGVITHGEMVVKKLLPRNGPSG